MGVTAVYSSKNFGLAKPGIETTCKAAWIAESLKHDPIEGVILQEPQPLTEAQAARVHSPAYLSALRTGLPTDIACASKIDWSPSVMGMALSACGGMLAAGQSALKHGIAGCLASGFHHAKRDRGDGFCTLNGLAIAAQILAEATKGHILILDLDAHFGGGTHSLIQAHPRIWQLDVSVHPFDNYQPGPRCRKSFVESSRDYLKTIWAGLQHAEAEWPEFLLCLYNAGMDAHQHCPMGGLRGIDELLITLREEMVFQWCRERQFPVAYCMAGGYIGVKLGLTDLVLLHRITIRRFRGES